MAFKVTYQANFPDDDNGDADTYDFLEGGVLKVWTKSSGKTFYFAPNVWKTVQADEKHGPGPKPKKQAPPRRIL